jgi:hypothetical protein
MRIARAAAVIGLALVPVTVGVLPVAAANAVPRWDARVAKYVRFVEQRRKLRFDHPVPVAFLGDAEFVRELQGDRKPTKQDRADARRTAGELRALGLVEGDVDLIQAERDLSAAGVVGFYDEHRKRLFVRGRDLTSTDVRVTLVHELTHALQDQHFDLGHLRRATRTSGESFALTALEEGDAVRVENAYVASLPRREQDAYARAAAPGSTAPDGPAKTAAVPPVLELLDAAPYLLGPEYVEVLQTLRGTKGVDAAFGSPPTSEDEIVDPVAASDSIRPRAVPTPKLADGEHRDGPAEDFGALSLFVTLAARIDPQDALHAAQAWGGDRALAYTRGSAHDECLRIAFRGDTPTGTRAIGDALAAWVASVPEGAASLDRHRGLVTLNACEVDATRAPTQDTLDHAVEVLVDRNELVLSFLKSRAQVVQARCVADRVVDDTEVFPLFAAATLTDEQQALLRDRITGYADRCRQVEHGTSVS